MLWWVGFDFASGSLRSGIWHLQRWAALGIEGFVVKFSGGERVCGVFFCDAFGVGLGLDETFFVEDMDFCSRTFA